MDATKANEILDEKLRESCAELFEAIPMNLKSVVGELSTAEDRQVASVIGFTGAQVRGSLTVRGPISFFAGTRPLAAQKTRRYEEHVGDWAGEFTNQLLGRVKTKLLAHGITLQLSTPATITGEHMQDTAARTGSLALTFRWLSDLVHVRFDANWIPGAELGEPATSKVAEAGDAILF